MVSNLKVDKIQSVAGTTTAIDISSDGIKYATQNFKNIEFICKNKEMKKIFNSIFKQ